MYALCDCNNFYASAERLFRPELNGLPIVVLSNNDGCVIARSQEAKDVGIKMGDPEFMVRDMFKTHGVQVFSSNYVLYGDISERVMTNLSRWFPKLQVYSIDEAFGFLDGVRDLDSYVPAIRADVVHSTGIPVSIGVAPSKTLAKMANKMAKKAGGVTVLNTPERIADAVKDFPIEDLWGIGRQYHKKLYREGIKTAADLRNLPEEWMNKNMTVVGRRMWMELWGQPCVSLADALPRKKGICVSRSFSGYVTEIDEMSEVITSHANRLGEKLRRDGSACLYLEVFMLTNVHREEDEQHWPKMQVKLPYPLNNSHDLCRYANTVMRILYKPGIRYRKAGVQATVLVPENEIMLNLFQPYNPAKNQASEVMDRINLAFGRGTLRMATEGYEKKWRLKNEFLSKRYTTRWHDIIKAK